MTYVAIHKEQLEELLGAAKMRYEALKDEQWCSVALDYAVDEAERAIKLGEDPAIIAARINFQTALFQAEMKGIRSAIKNPFCDRVERELSACSKRHEEKVAAILRGVEAVNSSLGSEHHNSASVDPNEKVRCLVLPEEIMDCRCPFELESLPAAFDSLEVWVREADIGDTVELEIVEMTRAELAALPEA